MQRFLALCSQAGELLSRRIDSFLMAGALAIVGVVLVTLFSAADQNLSRVLSQAGALGVEGFGFGSLRAIRPWARSFRAVPFRILSDVGFGSGPLRPMTFALPFEELRNGAQLLGQQKRPWPCPTIPCVTLNQPAVLT